MHAIELRRHLPADPGTVFDHLTVVDLLTRWWPSSGETDPRPGGTFRLHWAGPDVTLRGTYEVVDRPHRLRYTWSWDHEDVRRVDSFELVEAEDGGTELAVHHSASDEQERDDYRAGWEFFLPRLADVVAG